MQQHVRVLLLRGLGAVALRVGVGRDVERVGVQHLVDVVADVLGEARIDFVEHVLPVEQRPHLPDGLVADAGDDTADVLQHAVGGAALVPPVLLGDGQLVADAVDLAVLGEGHHVAGLGVPLHVVDARADVDERLEHGMGRDVLHPLAVDVDLAAVADRLEILRARADHGVTFMEWQGSRGGPAGDCASMGPILARCRYQGKYSFPAPCFGKAEASGLRCDTLPRQAARRKRGRRRVAGLRRTDGRAGGPSCGRTRRAGRG